MLQAFLFDHIEPGMPTFNTNLFSLGSTSNHLSHQLYTATEQSQTLLDEMLQVEQMHKKMIQTARKNNTKL